MRNSRKFHFWTSFVFFNRTFFPLFAAGFLDMTRRASATRRICRR